MYPCFSMKSKLNLMVGSLASVAQFTTLVNQSSPAILVFSFTIQVLRKLEAPVRELKPAVGLVPDGIP